MPRPWLIALLAALCWNTIRPVCAQETTPPIAPKTQETPLPPPVTLPPPPSPTPEVPNRPLTADEAARIALRLQPNITVARAGVQAAQGRTQQARSGELPTVGLGAGYTHQDTLATEGGGSTGNNTGGTGTGGATGTTFSFPGYQASLTVRQLLFDFNHTRDLVRQSAALERAANANLTGVQQAVVLQVKQAFYTYAQNVRLVAVNEANVRNTQAQLDLAQARLKSGLGLPSDVVRAQTAVADAVFQLNQAQNSASVARVNLALLMGIDPRTPIEAADTSEPAVTANDVNALVNRALAQRPEILAAQATLQAAQHGVNAAKTTNAPSVAANLGLSSRGSDFPPGNDFFTVGVSVQWNLFDSGLTAGRVKEARANVEAAQAQLTNARLVVVSDVSQAYLNLRTAEQRVTTADAEVANAEESVRLAEGRYRSGLGTFLDLITAQTALVTARTNRVNAQSAVDQARAALSRAIGAPLPPTR